MTKKQQLQNIIDKLDLEVLPVEGTLFKRTYNEDSSDGKSKQATVIIALYSDIIKSASCFHKLSEDEIWHFYDGDPFYLHLLYPNGKYKRITMGKDFMNGQHFQFIIPKGVWQAGEIVPGGFYSLFGCSMSPGFTNDCFVAADYNQLSKEYPQAKETIKRLTFNEDKYMPNDFNG